jgi:phosphoenolpyruvate-protein kinase (PTS system EI component)
MSFQVFGIPVSRGVAIGRAMLVASSRVDVAHYFIDASRVEAEIGRLLAATYVSGAPGAARRAPDAAARRGAQRRDATVDQ